MRKCQSFKNRYCTVTVYDKLCKIAVQYCYWKSTDCEAPQRYSNTEIDAVNNGDDKLLFDGVNLSSQSTFDRPV